MENEKIVTSETEAETKESKPVLQHIVVRQGMNLLLPLVCIFGCYVVIHGDSSPGGGFQGGVLLAGMLLMVFLAYGSKQLKATFHEGFLHSTETIAEIIYVAVGLVGIGVGGVFAWNMVAPNLGLESTMIMNAAVGYHVMAGISCLLIMMLGMLSLHENEVEEEDE